MKNTLTVFLCFCAAVCSAQIQFTRNDFGKDGDKVIYAIDTPGTQGLNFGATGPNHTWQFNTNYIYPNRYDSTTFLNATTNPNAPNVITNLLARSIGTGDQYLEVTDSFVKTIFDFPAVNLAGVKLKTLNFPLTYLSQFTDSTTATAKGKLSDFGLDPIPPFDSIRIQANVKLVSFCDGWGTLVLPDSTSHSALRVNQQIFIEADVYLHSIIGWTYVTHRSQQNGNYNWYAPASKNYLASVQLDTSGNITNFIYKIKKSPPYKKPARLLSISPDTIMQGDTIDIAVKGLNTSFTIGEPEIYTWSGNVLQTTVINDSTMTVKLTVPYSTSPGTQYFRVYTPTDGYMYLNDALTIITSPLAPRLVGIGPNYGPVGQLTTIIVTGYNTHFTKGMIPRFYADSISEGTIYVQSFRALNDTAFTCDILVESTAGYVPFSLYTSNLVDGSLSLRGAFIVTHTGLDEDLSSTVHVYPNPATDQLIISLPATKELTLIQMFDLTGKEVKRVFTQDHENILMVDDLDHAMYILKITGEELNLIRKVSIGL